VDSRRHGGTKKKLEADPFNLQLMCVAEVLHMPVERLCKELSEDELLDWFCFLQIRNDAMNMGPT
jgi:hypothetical protein